MRTNNKVIRISNCIIRIIHLFHMTVMAFLICFMPYLLFVYFKVIIHLFVVGLATVYAEIWPPFGHLTPNNYIPPPVCTYQQEKVYEDILEEVCTTEDVKNCSVQLVKEQQQVLETVCEDIVENICDEVECEIDPDNCEECEDNDQTCQEVFKAETKTECSYETQIDKKCFRNEI